MSYVDYLPEAIILTSIFVMFILGGIQHHVLVKSKVSVDRKND